MLRPAWRRSTKQQLIYALGLAVLLLGLFLNLSRRGLVDVCYWRGAGLGFLHPQRLASNQSLIAVADGRPFRDALHLHCHPPGSSLVSLYQSPPNSFLNLTTDATFSARLDDWTLARNDWRKQPLTGWGPGSFAVIHGEIRSRPAWILYLSLRLLQETGVIGMAMFGGFVFTLILPAIKTIRQQIPPVDRATLLGLVLSYLALIGIAYQSTDGIWIAASWIHAGLIAAGTRVLRLPADGKNH